MAHRGPGGPTRAQGGPTRARGPQGPGPQRPRGAHKGRRGPTRAQGGPQGHMGPARARPTRAQGRPQGPSVRAERAHDPSIYIYIYMYIYGDICIYIYMRGSLFLFAQLLFKNEHVHTPGLRFLIWAQDCYLLAAWVVGLTISAQDGSLEVRVGSCNFSLLLLTPSLACFSNLI